MTFSLGSSTLEFLLEAKTIVSLFSEVSARVRRYVDFGFPKSLSMETITISVRANRAFVLISVGMWNYASTPNASSTRSIGYWPRSTTIRLSSLNFVRRIFRKIFLFSNTNLFWLVGRIRPNHDALLSHLDTETIVHGDFARTLRKISRRFHI